MFIGELKSSDTSGGISLDLHIKKSDCVGGHQGNRTPL